MGTVSAELLTRSGIGHLRLIDRDFVEESNLQRQSLFTEAHARRRIPKAAAAREALSAINSGVELRADIVDLDRSNAERVLQSADIVLDGTDNYETRFLINDYAVKNDRPWIYGAALGSYGIALGLFAHGGGPCLRCWIPDAPAAGSIETCETAGVLGTATHAVGTFQAAEAMRFIVDGRFSGRLFQADVWAGAWSSKPLGDTRDEACPCCGEKRFEYLEGTAGGSGRLCGRNAVQLRPRRESAEVDLQALFERLRPSLPVEKNEYLLRVQAEGCEIALFRDGRSIVRGTDDPVRARSIYSKIIGC